MSSVIVHSDAPILLVGAGEISPEDLTDSLTWAPKVVAADGGAAAVLAAGLVPDAVVGDLDSVPDDRRLAGRLHRMAGQDDTDFDKGLAATRAPLVLAVGFSGGRMDHSLAVVSGMARRPDVRVVVVGRTSVMCLLPPRFEIDLAPGSPVSLWPLMPVTGRSEGLRWPLAGVDLAPDGRIGTSNEATGPVRLEADRPGLFLILRRADMGTLITSLAASSARWPARG